MNYYVKLKICNLKCNLEATKVANVIFVYFRCLRTQAIQLKIRGDHLGCRGPGAYGIPRSSLPLMVGLVDFANLQLR